MSIAALVAAGSLRQGAAGDAIKAIQLALRARGYPLTGTGWFGHRLEGGGLRFISWENQSWRTGSRAAAIKTS